MPGKKGDICVAFVLFVDDRVNIREAIIVEVARISGSASLVQLTGVDLKAAPYLGLVGLWPKIT